VLAYAVFSAVSGSPIVLLTVAAIAGVVPPGSSVASEVTVTPERLFLTVLVASELRGA
jgi:hypothetical protein